MAELFHRLGQAGEISLAGSPAKDRLAIKQQFQPATVDLDVDYTPANLIALEVELAQELALVLARLQR